MPSNAQSAATKRFDPCETCPHPLTCETGAFECSDAVPVAVGDGSGEALPPIEDCPPEGRIASAAKVKHIEERCPRCGMATVWWPPGQRRNLECVDARCRARVKA